eukprot:GGOE01036354.1.p1 GENE.GGOE01036354.1~~GGOE01036354.1.p1  ORF type:complete len:258 (+),score=87.78 GGOE01036354.1:107-880(+)
MPTRLAGYGLAALMQAQETIPGESQQPSAAASPAGVLKSIIHEPHQLQSTRLLDVFKPFLILNDVEAIVDIRDVESFRAIDSWDQFVTMLQAEFSPQRIQSLFYSVRSSPRDFPNQLRGELFDHLKRFWLLERVVAENKRVRAKEQAEEEARQALLKAAADEAAAKKASAKAAKQEARRAAGLEEEEEEEDEEEESAEKKPRMSRKEREALEAAEKQRKKDQRERTKVEAAQEYELGELQAKLERLLKIACIRVEFA